MIRKVSHLVTIEPADYDPVLACGQVRATQLRTV